MARSFAPRLQGSAAAAARTRAQRTGHAVVSSSSRSGSSPPSSGSKPKRWMVEQLAFRIAGFYGEDIRL